MRTTPTSHAEVESWLTVLREHGRVHRVETQPDGTWTVRRRPDSTPRTLHHPVLALDYVAEILREIRGHGAGLPG